MFGVKAAAGLRKAVASPAHSKSPSRLYRLGWDAASAPPVPERTRRQACWMMWTLVAVGVSGSAWEIVRAYQRALGG